MTADRFGEDGVPGSTDTDAPITCEHDEDCWDGDDSTEDFCGEDGFCVFLGTGDADTDTDTDTAEPGSCDIFGDFTGDGVIDVAFDNGVQQLSYTDSLLNAKVMRIDVEEPRRIWAGIGDDAGHGLMFVLLDDCANSSANRIAWGEFIYSPLLDPGVYYLAAFSTLEDIVPVSTRYLKSISCEDASPLKPGRFTDSLRGLADDFSGSCVQNDGKGPRGDKVYMFDVPDEEIWDVTVDLYPAGASLDHHMYLTRGCGQDELEEIDCQMEYSTDLGANEQDREKVTIEGRDLMPGRYYLYVDTTKALVFDTGDFDLDFSVSVDTQGV